jgi:hypothetical protein
MYACVKTVSLVILSIGLEYYHKKLNKYVHQIIYNPISLPIIQTSIQDPNVCTLIYSLCN